MQATLTQFLNGMTSERDRAALRSIMEPIVDRMSSQTHNSAGLVIKAGGGVLAKIGSTAWQGIANGISIKIDASTDMPSLLGLNITAAYFNVACFFIDSAGTVTAAFGTEATTRAGVKFPNFPVGKALVGYLVITHSSAFTGNTTALDTATTVYVNPVGPFDPSVRI